LSGRSSRRAESRADPLPPVVWTQNLHLIHLSQRPCLQIPLPQELIRKFLSAKGLGASTSAVVWMQNLHFIHLSQRPCLQIPLPQELSRRFLSAKGLGFNTIEISNQQVPSQRVSESASQQVSLSASQRVSKSASRRFSDSAIQQFSESAGFARAKTPLFLLCAFPRKKRQAASLDVVVHAAEETWSGSEKEDERGFGDRCDSMNLSRTGGVSPGVWPDSASRLEAAHTVQFRTLFTASERNFHRPGPYVAWNV